MPVLARRAIRPVTSASSAGAAALAASDAPTTDFAHDRLQFAPLARGISRFLRNPATEPPLTIAVSGDWGSGKSSLMNLVCNDLRRYGCRPVWFNAWHHQNDEQLLAALLSAIRDQALPSWFSLDGLSFRAKLLLRRSTKHFMLACAVLAALAGTAAFMLNHDAAEWQRAGSKLTALATSIGKPERAKSGETGASAPQAPASSAASATNAAIDEHPEDSQGLDALQWVKLFGPAATLLAALAAMARALKAFGVDPAVLLTTTSAESFKLKDASAATNFRARFAEQFGDVVDALPYRMVIVIDDLDRCKPEAVLIAMEGVNYLTCSGDCFVIFGMATHRVQAALAMSFEKIAKELVDLDIKEPATQSANKSDPERAREQRRRYARDYLEKLINVEVPVPSREDLPAHQLFEPTAGEPDDRLRAASQKAARLLPIAGLLAALLVGWAVGWIMPGLQDDQRKPIVQAALPTSAAAPQASVPLASRAVPANLSASAPLFVPTVQPGDDRPIGWAVLLWPVAGVVIGMSLWGLWKLRRTTREVQDSDAFIRALQIWTPLVYQHRATPRAVKRFGNRVRYLAMLQQAVQLDESGWDLLWKRLGHWFPTRDKATPAARPRPSPLALDEHRIVALAALHEVFGGTWLERLEARQHNSYPPDAKVAATLANAISEYSASIGVSWPPSPEEIEAFERSLKGVRVSGGPADANDASRRESNEGIASIASREAGQP